MQQNTSRSRVVSTIIQHQLWTVSNSPAASPASGSIPVVWRLILFAFSISCQLWRGNLYPHHHSFFSSLLQGNNHILPQKYLCNSAHAYHLVYCSFLLQNSFYVGYTLSSLNVCWSTKREWCRLSKGQQYFQGRSGTVNTAERSQGHRTFVKKSW